MKKIIYTLLALTAISQLHAQVGIGTNTPDNSAMLEVQSNERGILFPRMTSAQRNGIASPANGLHVFDTNTNSLWYFNGTVWINTVSVASLGDVKSGFQPNDHSGWIKMDGRAINTLNANQQAAAITLGFTTSLPDATTAYLVQNNGTMGSVSGTNTRTLTQANLPNVSFTGTTNTSGGHNHDGLTGNNGGHSHTGTTSTTGSHNHTGSTSTDGNHSHSNNSSGNQGGFGLIRQSDGGTNTVTDTDFTPGEPDLVRSPIALTINSSGNHSHTLNINNNGDHSHTFTTSTVANHNHTIGTDGAHTHAVTVASGGSATSINIAPRSLTVNMFVYLGQ
jgi:hypothetical protein